MAFWRLCLWGCVGDISVAVCPPVLFPLQDSDRLWRISPPAKEALKAVLTEPDAALVLQWVIIRTAPLASANGRGSGPACAGEVRLQLAGRTRERLLQVRFWLGCAAA